MLVLGKSPQNLDLALWLSVAIGVAVTALSCLDSCRRDVN